MSAAKLFRFAKPKAKPQIDPRIARLRVIASQIESHAHLRMLMKTLPEAERVPMLRGLRPYLPFVIPDEWVDEASPREGHA